MLATFAFVLGILLAVIVLAVARRKKTGMDGSKPTAPGWLTLGFGLGAATALAVATRLVPQNGNSGMGFFLVSITLACAAVVVGIWTLKSHDRHWPTWVGLIAGLVPAIVWILFAAGNILGFGE